MRTTGIDYDYEHEHEKRAGWLNFIFLILPLLVLAGCADMEAQNQLAGQTREIQKLREENKQFQDAYYKIKEQLDNQNSQSQKNVDQLTRDLDTAQNQKSQKEKDLEDRLRARIVDLQTMQKTMLDQKGAYEVQVAQLQQALQAATTERNTALGNLKLTQDKLSAEGARANELGKQVAQLKTDAAAAGMQIAGLQKDVATRIAALKTETDARQAAETKAANTAQLLAAQGKTLQDTQTRLADAQKKAEEGARIQETAGQLQKDKEALTQERDALAKDKTTLAANNDAANKKIDALTRERDALVKDKASLSSELTAAKNAPRPAPAQATPAEDGSLKKQATALEQKLKGNADARGARVVVDARGMRVILPNALLFDESKTGLSERASGVLGPIAQALNQLDDRPVRIEGHTDNQLNQDLPYADNWALGYARADRVREFLMKGGVSSSRLTAASRAQSEPLASNDTAEGRRQNRRVEIVVGSKN